MKSLAKNVKFISIGGNAISVSRIVAVAAPAKRLIQQSRSKGLLVDATSKKTGQFPLWTVTIW
ncbi:hypothetical protein A1A1_03942 [Planococcus antarcticus DSM 14505]|uniref:Uncharacterized protein n=1 Tax=Planococcus antarcticus DSM 14505 TaxID=1185653 RepID=A0AA87INR9_9BACL|nr:extracellular matrix/biofilm biosynthesis regulator RemA family protein [Planococcus antarcticus]EIM07757.1 hypothetical protein A1A1_03942 [Planococcus antarcticus DSM 14505]